MRDVIEAVRQLHSQGLSDTAIAHRLGRSVAWANRIRRRLRLPRQVAPSKPGKLDERAAEAFYRRGLVDREIAAKLGTSRELVQKWRRRKEHPPNGWHNPSTRSRPA